MPTPKFRQFTVQSVSQVRALAKVDASAIARSRAFIDALTAIGQVKDINGRVVRVRASDVRALLNGKRFSFDEITRRYLNASGGVVPEATVKASAEAIVAGSQARIATLYDALKSGALTGTQWRTEMQSAIVDNHIGNAALAHGKFNLPPPVRERLTASVLEQFEGNAKFPGLRGFVQDIAGGRYGQSELLNGANVRGLQYPLSGRVVYENEYAATKADAGFNEVCRILAAVKHCDTCAAEAAKGFVPQSEAAPIGSDLCGPGCHCTQVFRKSGGAVAPSVERAIERAQTVVEQQRQIKAEKMKDSP